MTKQKLSSVEGSLEGCIGSGGERCRFAVPAIKRNPFGGPTVICALAEVRSNMVNVETNVSERTDKSGKLVNIAKPGMRIVVGLATGFMRIKVEKVEAQSGVGVDDAVNCVQGFGTKSARAYLDQVKIRLTELHEKYIE